MIYYFWLIICIKARLFLLCHSDMYNIVLMIIQVTGSMEIRCRSARVVAYYWS